MKDAVNVDRRDDEVDRAELRSNRGGKLPSFLKDNTSDIIADEALAHDLLTVLVLMLGNKR